MPAAAPMACCSAMPTSKTRSEWAAAKRPRPTGWSIAAVSATMSSRSAPSATSSAPKASVQVASTDGVSDSPVHSSIRPMAWKRSRSWFSAGAKPLPLRVMAWTMTGPPKPLAWRMATVSASRS